LWDKNIKDLGTILSKVISAFKHSEEIRDVLFGSQVDESDFDLQRAYEDCIWDCLYVKGIQTEAKTYICADTVAFSIGSNIKTIKLVIQVFCEKSLLKYSKKGYVGNRPTILAEIIEEILISDENFSRNFGIGKLELNSVDIFTNGENHYGKTMEFIIKNFR
jgi:hypothetical protein